MPDLILEGNQRRGRQRCRRRRSLGAVDDKTGDVDFSIGIIWITFAIPGEYGRSYSGNLEERFDHSCLAQIAHQQVALGIDVWSDVMGDLPRIMAQAPPTGQRYRAEPNRTAIRSFFKDQPQADVMSLIGAPAIRLFESK